MSYRLWVQKRSRPLIGRGCSPEGRRLTCLLRDIFYTEDTSADFSRADIQFHQQGYPRRGRWCRARQRPRRGTQASHSRISQRVPPHASVLDQGVPRTFHAAAHSQDHGAVYRHLNAVSTKVSPISASSTRSVKNVKNVNCAAANERWPVAWEWPICSSRTCLLS